MLGYARNVDRAIYMLCSNVVFRRKKNKKSVQFDTNNKKLYYVRTCPINLHGLKNKRCSQ